MTSPKTKSGKRNLYSLFETDKELETNGIDLKFGDSTFRCKRAGGSNRKFETAFNEKTRAFQTKMQLASLSEEQSDKLLMEVYFEAVVLGWEDVTDREGNDRPFDLKNFTEVMTDLPEVWRNLRAAAANVDNFLIQQTKEAAEQMGNS